jgi:hypothetical protein
MPSCIFFSSSSVALPFLFMSSVFPGFTFVCSDRDESNYIFSSYRANFPNNVFLPLIEMPSLLYSKFPFTHRSVFDLYSITLFSSSVLVSLTVLFFIMDFFYTF